MRESEGYMMILEEGQWAAMRRTVLRLGRKKFGPPSAEVEAAVNAITDLDRLDRMVDTLDDASDWQAWLRS